MRHSFVEQLDENAQLGTEKSIYNLLYQNEFGGNHKFNSTKC